VTVRGAETALAVPLELVGAIEDRVDARAAALTRVVRDLERLAIEVEERADLRAAPPKPLRTRRRRSYRAAERGRELVSDDGLENPKDAISASTSPVPGGRAAR
jgi:hypothetical protein